MLPRLSLVVPLTVLVCSIPTGCKRTVGDALRPDDRTAAEAVGAELDCEAGVGRFKPLVVDWDPDARVDLEAAMQGSLVVVKYDCPNIEILPGCAVDGSYTYAGVSRKEQVIQMQNMDDVHANIPISSAKVGVEIQSGRAIDLATVLVGRQSTTVNTLSQELLTGDCAGATHFVRSASLGAFSMATGSKGQAAASVELFGYGGGASSDSSRSALNADGSRDSCMTSDPNSPTPPAECQAPVRIELVPIGGEPIVATEGSKTEAAENPCMPGYVYSDGMCARPSADRAHLCDPDDKADCEQQCSKGDAQSCFNYGRLLTDQSQPADEPLTMACDADIYGACTLLGETLYYDADPDEDPNADQMVNRAYQLVVKGCEGGDEYACEIGGDMMGDNALPSYNEASAYKFYTRSCDLGSGTGCSCAADKLFNGKGTARDVGKGLQLLLRSCQAGAFDVCAEIGGILSAGKYELPRDMSTASKYFQVACAGDLAWCERAGEVALEAGDTDLATRLFEYDCGKDPDSTSCDHL